MSLLTRTELSVCHVRTVNGHTNTMLQWTQQLQLHYSTATGSRVVICINFKLISINKVNVRFPFPGVGHLCDGDQFNGLTLQNKNSTCLLHKWKRKQFLLFYVLACK